MLITKEEIMTKIVKDGVPVISSAQKFIIPVPTTDAVPLVYPAETIKNDKDVSGQVITDWQGNPVGDLGIVFWNGKDNCWQAAPINDGVVIINQVTEDQASRLTRFAEYLSDDGFTCKDLELVLEVADIFLDLEDVYNSDTGFITSKMSKVSKFDTGIPNFGLHKRDDRDVLLATYIEGEGEIEGSAATVQKFENGAWVVIFENNPRLIQPDIFIQTYRNSDGSLISSE